MDEIRTGIRAYDTRRWVRVYSFEYVFQQTEFGAETTKETNFLSSR